MPRATVTAKKKTPTPSTPTWASMGSPSTSTDRVAFFTACLKAFDTVRTLGPVSDAILALPPQTPTGGVRDDPPGASYRVLLDNTPTNLRDPRCCMCGERAAGMFVCNPFADWACVLCDLCKAKAAKLEASPP